MAGKDGLGQKLEVGLLAEEVGFIGGQQIDHGLQLVGFGAAGDQAMVLGEARQAMVLQAPSEASDQQDLFRVRQADPGNLVDQLLELRKLRIADVGVAVARRGAARLR